MANPIPFVVAGDGVVGDAPDGSIPIALFGADGSGSVDPVVQALIDAGFGEPGEVLVTNGTGDGFEWASLD